MRKRSLPHTFVENLNARKRQIENELAKVPNAAKREQLAQQIKEIEAVRHMESWLRSSGLRAPT